MLLNTFKKIMEAQEIHIHNYPTGSSSSSKQSSDTTSSNSSDDTSSNSSVNSDANQSSQSTQTNQGLQSSQPSQSPSTDQKVAKFMNNRNPNVSSSSSNDQKKNDNKSMKDFKEVFIRNHVRRYRRKPSIGLMKQTFGAHS